MKINKKFIIVGLSFLLLCWIGNLIYYKDHVLNEPLFIKHYYDIDKGDRKIDLFYIQNINSQNKITSIKFPEIGQQEMNFIESDSEIDKRYYMLKNVAVRIIDNYENDIPNEYKNKVITKAQVEFSDGKVMNVDLGKIYLNNDETENKDLRFTSSGVTKDNITRTSIGVKANTVLGADEKIKIIGIKSNFEEEIKDSVKIYINEEPLDKVKFPIYLKKDDVLTLRYVFDFNKNNMKINNAYFIKFNFLTEDPEGDKGNCYFHIYNNMPTPTCFDIDSLKNDLGGD